jgi:hypothetical protein
MRHTDEFQARSPDELSLARGDRIELIERDDDFGDGWFLGKNMATGDSGLFPEGAYRPEGQHGTDAAPWPSHRPSRLTEAQSTPDQPRELLSPLLTTARRHSHPPTKRLPSMTAPPTTQVSRPRSLPIPNQPRPQMPLRPQPLNREPRLRCRYPDRVRQRQVELSRDSRFRLRPEASAWL